MRRHYVCPNCANPVMRGAHCVCRRSIHTISSVGATTTAETTAATPMWSDFFFGLPNWRRRRSIIPRMVSQEVARMPMERDVIDSMGVSRSDSSLDMLCAYIVVPIFGTLTILSGVYLILSTLIPIMDVMFNIIHYSPV